MFSYNTLKSHRSSTPPALIVSIPCRMAIEGYCSLLVGITATPLKHNLVSRGFALYILISVYFKYPERVR